MSLLDLVIPRGTTGRHVLADSLVASPKAASYGPSQWSGDGGGWFSRAWGGGPADSGVAVNEWNALTLTVVYACVSIIADNIGTLPCNVYRKRAGGGADLQPDHPVQTLLHDEPNEEMSACVFFQTKQHHALLWGNGYSEIERTRGGDPAGLWLLYPDRTAPRKPAGEPLSYRSSINGKSVTLNPADVLHIPAMGFDGYLGYSPVHIARNAIGMGLAAEKFGGKFFANDSRSGGFLSHPGKLGPAGTKNVQDSFQEQGGPDNAFKVKVLEEGMKFISTTIPPDDAQFLGSREFQVAEIARMYRVPLILLQSMEKATSWGSGIEQQMIAFVVWTIAPWLRKWEQELTRKLLTLAERKAGFYIKFNLNALVRGDMKARAAFYRALYAIGALNPNEIRAYEELNPYAEGDKFAIPLNMRDPEEPLPEEPSEPRPGEDPDNPGHDLNGDPMPPPEET